MRVFSGSRNSPFNYRTEFVAAGSAPAGGGRLVALQGPTPRLPYGLLAGALLAVGLAAWLPHAPADQANREQLLRQAEDGEPRAQLQLGLAYRDGRWALARDHRQAALWFERAARAGDSYAAALLGDAYAAGDGVARDAVAARHWWRQGAEAGNARAEARLGMALVAADASPAERYRGYRWLQQASDQGDPLARRQLGIDAAGPAFGLRSDQPPGPLARFWHALETMGLDGQSGEGLKQRALDGDADAQFELAMRYRDGAWGVAADPRQALAWLRMAAHQGNPQALASVAEAGRGSTLGLAPVAARAGAASAPLL